MPSDVILSKVANALVKDAELEPPLASSTGAVAGALDARKERIGGLWVGGRLTLTSDELTFRPNGLNAGIQNGSLEITIPLRSVDEVLDLPGFVTKVIGVRHSGRTDRFRTWGARKVARRIREAVQVASQV